MDPAVGVDAASGGDRPGGQQGRGSGVAAARVPVMRAARSEVRGLGPVVTRLPLSPVAFLGDTDAGRDGSWTST